MQYENILTEVRDGVLIVTLNRPQARNAINSTLWAELCDAFSGFEQNAGLKVAIITNNGPAFCAGADLKAIASGWNEDPPEGFEDWGFAGLTKHYFDKPVICAVRGFCLGGGTEIALAADLVVASDASVFGLPEPRRGLTAAGGGALMRLGQQLPMKFAMQLALTAEPVDAATALRFGLINAVVSDEETLETALEFARSITLSSPLAIRCTKRTIVETASKDVTYPSEGWEIVHKYEQLTRFSADAKEGSMAFADKRQPVWPSESRVE